VTSIHVTCMYHVWIIYTNAMVIVEIYRITKVLKIETDTIASLTAIDTSDNISSKLPSDRLSLFGRSVNNWRVSALARTLQLFTDRPNNHSRSQELRTFLYDVADLWLETVTNCFHELCLTDFLGSSKTKDVMVTMQN